MNIIPHVAQNTSGRRSAVPDAIAQSEGYAVSQQKRKLHRAGLWLGQNRSVGQMFVLTMAAYSLTRMRARLQGQ